MVVYIETNDVDFMTKIKSRELVVLKCPFCNKGDIEITYIPFSTKTKKGPWGGYKSGVTEVSDNTIIHTEKCPNCGKSKKEIQKNLKGKEEITEEDRKKIIKRMKKQGLPTQIDF